MLLIELTKGARQLSWGEKKRRLSFQAHAHARASNGGIWFNLHIPILGLMDNKRLSKKLEQNVNHRIIRTDQKLVFGMVILTKLLKLSCIFALAEAKCLIGFLFVT